jgi:hypothetical protein
MPFGIKLPWTKRIRLLEKENARLRGELEQVRMQANGRLHLIRLLWRRFPQIQESIGLFDMTIGERLEDNPEDMVVSAIPKV